MKKIVFIKFGGGLITDKKKPRSLKLGTMQNLARDLKKIVRKEKNTFFILGNGAGSFGHYEAVKYKLPSKINNPKKRLGFATVQESVKTLNKIFVDQLLKEGIPAISIHQSSLLTARGGELSNIFLESVEGLLALRVTPVIYGDIVFDKIRGSHIFSTEDAFSFLIEDLTKKGYKVEKVIYLTAVDGVLDKNKKVIEKINNLRQLKKSLFKTQGFDVTGDMRHKIDKALSMAKKRIKIYITNGNKKGALAAAFYGKKFTGTLIE